jgi:hypothetical protein
MWILRRAWAWAWRGREGQILVVRETGRCRRRRRIRVGFDCSEVHGRRAWRGGARAKEFWVIKGSAWEEWAERCEWMGGDDVESRPGQVETGGGILTFLLSSIHFLLPQLFAHSPPSTDLAEYNTHLLGKIQSV